MTIGNVLNKVTMEYITDVNIETYVPNPKNNNTVWVINPNVSGVIGSPTSLWTIDVDTNGNFIRVRLMTPQEMDINPALVAQAKATQLALLQAAADNAGSAGVVSNALGTPHLYSSTETDRIYLIGALLTTLPDPSQPAGGTIPYACIDVATGQSNFDVHTYQQLKQVVRDGVNFLLNILMTLATKQQLVTNATSVSQVQAITWTSTP